jgi:hypothetical protein
MRKSHTFRITIPLRATNMIRRIDDPMLDNEEHLPERLLKRSIAPISLSKSTTQTRHLTAPIK